MFTVSSFHSQWYFLLLNFFNFSSTFSTSLQLFQLFQLFYLLHSRLYSHSFTFFFFFFLNFVFFNFARFFVVFLHRQFSHDWTDLPILFGMVCGFVCEGLPGSGTEQRFIRTVRCCTVLIDEMLVAAAGWCSWLVLLIGAADWWLRRMPFNPSYFLLLFLLRFLLRCLPHPQLYQHSTVFHLLVVPKRLPFVVGKGQVVVFFFVDRENFRRQRWSSLRWVVLFVDGWYCHRQRRSESSTALVEQQCLGWILSVERYRHRKLRRH